MNSVDFWGEKRVWKFSLMEISEGEQKKERKKKINVLVIKL